MGRRTSIERYLATVTAGLVGSRRSRRRLLTELGDHLEDAVASKTARGIDPVEAERQALAEMGDARAVVSAWRGRTERTRRRQRARVVLAVAFASAAAAVLGIASAASGHPSSGTVRTIRGGQSGTSGLRPAVPGAHLRATSPTP